MFARYLLLFIFIFIFINPLSTIAATQTIPIYKWTDKLGIIHYSQFPPEGKIKNVEVVQPKVSIPISTPEKNKKNRDLMVNIKKYIEERESARKTRVTQKKIAKRDKNNCTAARKSLELYQSGRRVRTRVNDNNEVQILSEEECLNRIKRSEKNIKSYC